MRTHRLLVALAPLFGASLWPAAARGGGFEIPDNGTEALGRGGAFVAKADDGTALQYNVSGLARQRGTRLTLDANLLLHNTSFTRAGSYPGIPGDPNNPEAGKAYPTIQDRDNVFLAPYLALSTDLGGRLKKWTLALGLFGPPSIGRHNYGVGSEKVCSMIEGKQVCDDPPATVDGSKSGLPAPSRYDISKTDLLIVFPTLAVAYQPHPVIAIGFGWQAVIAHFDLANANLTPLGNSCPVPDFGGCDTYGRVRTFGTSFSSSPAAFDKTPVKFSPGLTSFGWLFGLLLHPSDNFDVGWSFRPQIDIRTVGDLHPVTPASAPKIGDVPAVFTATVPATMRLGGRWVSRYADDSERADLELDLTWENWEAERAGRLYAIGDALFVNTDNTLDAAIVHNYKDTFGLRLGGAYNLRVRPQLLATVRAGFYFDSAATREGDTRLDFNTLDKFAGTLGGGLKWRGFQVNLAYAFVGSPTRTVSDSRITAISATDGTNYPPGTPVIRIGDGTYRSAVHILSLGFTVNFSDLKRSPLARN